MSVVGICFWIVIAVIFINFFGTIMQLVAEVLGIRNDAAKARLAQMAAGQPEPECMVEEYVKPRRKAKARRKAED